MEAPATSPYAALHNVDLTKLAASPFQRHVAGQKANRYLWQILLASLATGGLGRGLLGMTRMATNPGSGFKAMPNYQEVGMPRPQEEEEAGAKLASEKTAVKQKDLIGGDTGLPDDDFTSFFSQTTAGIPDMPLERREGNIPQSGKDFWLGATADKAMASPLFLPLAAGLGAGGLYGGYKLVDYILDARREHETQSQLDKAKKRYQSLLKHSADDAELNDELEKLAEAYVESPGLEKDALGMPNPTNWAGRAVGGGLTLALLSALLSGKLSYDYFKKRNQRAISQAAVERRAKERRGGMAPLQFKFEDEQYA